MKKQSGSQSAFFNIRVLIGLFVFFTGVFLALLGFGAFSDAFAQGKRLTPEQQKAALSESPEALKAALKQSSGIQVIHSYYNDVSRPLREMATEWPALAQEEPREANPNPKIPHRHVDSPDPVIQNNVFQRFVAPYMPAPILNFAGIPYPGVGCNCAPPDTNGYVGKTHYVQMVNKGYQVFDKNTGTSLLGPNTIQSVWTGFPGKCTTGSGDPVVLYDHLADRWVISQFAQGPTVSTIQDQCMAVSATGDPTGSWYRYGFHMTENFYDYPHMGVWPDAYYVSANIFNTAGSMFLGPQAFAADRAKMLVGQPATIVTPGITGGTNEESFLPADLDGVIAPPAGAANPFVEFPSGTVPLQVYKMFLFHPDFANPANTTFSPVANNPPAAGFTSLCQNPTNRNCVPQLGSTTNLDAIGDRLMFRNQYRRFPDGHDSLVDNFTVNANSVAGVRWFELRNVITGPVTVFQESTYQPDSVWRWMGSVAMDNQGNLAVGYSASNSTMNPQIRYAGRLVSDPLNALTQGEATLFAGTGSQTASGSRWGDYSAMTVDPVDDCTFWFTSEHYDTTSSFNWRTRIGSFKFDQCTPPAKGTAHFTVTVCDGGSPLLDALVLVDGNLYGSSLAGGLFDASLTPGNHSYSITKPPIYGAATGNFTINDGQTTNVGVCLVGTPLVQSAGSTLVAEGCTPPNNAIDPGETVTVNLRLTNNGGASTTNLVATLQASGGVVNPSGPQNYGPISVGGTAERPFTFTANGTCGGTITATLQLQDGATNLGTATFSFTLGAVSSNLTENFDGVTPPTLPSGWTADQGTNAGGFSLWVTSASGTPAPVSDTAPNAAFSVDPTNLFDSRLYTPVITYTAGAQLTFRQNYDLEQSNATTAYDAGVLEMAINGGAFQDIVAAGGTFVTGGYNHTFVSTGFMNPIAGARASWSGVSSGGFVSVAVNLPASAAGQPVQLRWRMCSDTSVSHAGWRVDTVSISQRVCATSCGPAAQSVVSRKAHGAAGTFDIDLPLSGTSGVECRTGGTTNDYTLVATFGSAVTVNGSPQAQVTTGTGTVGSGGVSNGGAVTVGGNTVTVPLTNVTNAQTIQVTLFGVNDGSSTGNVIIPMSVLVGDTSGNRAVNSGDVAQTKARLGLTLDTTTFRSDVNANGAINAGDVSQIKSLLGTGLP